jgi:hypothetical protein
MDRRQFILNSASLAVALRSWHNVSGIVGESHSLPPSALGHPLMAPHLDHSLAVRCLKKTVFSNQTIDDMETDRGWVASPVVKLSYTNERMKSGTRSMRFSTLMRNDEFIKSARSKSGHFSGDEAAFVGQPFSAFAMLNFTTPQDWTPYNRISLWCYLHPTTTPTTSISLQFLCNGASAGPWDPLPIHFIGDLKPGDWNHLTWEISEYPRDKVSQFILFKPTSGLPLAGAESEMTFDFDDLRLERVDVEPVSGWTVTPGKIAYSHFGYRPGASKVAYCNESEARTFTLVNAASGAVVSHLPVKKVENARGSYAVLDFSEHTVVGTYRLECGKSQSEEFPIGEDSWNLLIDATLNTFNGFRCGCAVPGAHDACHLDTFIEYNGERRSMAGGWHDAANNTQFADSTHLSIYTLLQLHERLAGDPAQKERARRALDEAAWGLDWSLRMRFAPGVRLAKNYTSYWTDTKIGTDDDVVQQDAGHDLRENIYALVGLSCAARVLKDLNPSLAAQALRAAEEDYAEIRPNVNAPFTPVTYGDAGRGTWRDLAAYLTVSTVELYRATGKPAYRADALRFGGWLSGLQEQSFVDGSPVTGYFYADAARTQIQRETYGSCDDSGPLALQALCETFPDEPDWIKWYAGLVIYSEYYCRQGSLASAPFQVIPSAVWRRKDLETDIRRDRLGESLAVRPMPMFPTPPTEESTRKQMLAMYEAGTPLGPDMRLRIFPIWYNHVQHGSTTAHLCRTAGLGCAAQVRGKLDLAELAARQIQWVVGANPFSRSLMFGVGYDYWQNFTVDNVNFVGGLGLGMNSYEADAPAWPNNAVFPYKEQWSYSTSRMAINLSQSGVSARIKGRAAAATTLREQHTGVTVRLAAGDFDRAIAPGRYLASSAGFEWNLELVGGRTYSLPLDAAHAVTFSLESTGGDEDVTIRARLRGTGKHEIGLKLFNFEAAPANREVVFKGKEEVVLEWKLRVADKTKPWIAVASPASALDLRQEVYGRVGTHAELS